MSHASSFAVMSTLYWELDTKLALLEYQLECNCSLHWYWSCESACKPSGSRTGTELVTKPTRAWIAQAEVRELSHEVALMGVHLLEHTVSTNPAHMRGYCLALEVSFVLFGGVAVYSQKCLESRPIAQS
jgi:hypothetical protein